MIVSVSATHGGAIPVMVYHVVSSPCAVVITSSDVIYVCYHASKPTY